MVKRKKVNFLRELVKIVIISSGVIFFSFASFKKIRSLFPVPEVGSEKLVGFAQYFGYSLYFDTIFFLFIISIPLIVVFFFKKFGNEN